MSYQPVDWLSRDRLAEGDLVRQDPFTPPEDSFVFDLKEALDLPPPPTPSSTSASVFSGPSSTRHLDAGSLLLSNRPSYQSPPPPLSQAQSSSASFRRVVPQPGFNMASMSKAQSQCHQLCTTVAAACDQVAEKMSEYITSVKHLPHGFGLLANDVLDTCQVLSYIEAGLGEAARNQESLPLDMIAVLDKKFRAAQIDLRGLDQLVSKQLEYERKGTMGRMRRGFGKMFGENSLERMSQTLAKTREDMKVATLMFHTKLGTDRMESELGIGYIGLVSALEGTEHRRQRPASTVSADKTSSYRAPSNVTTTPQLQRSVEDHHTTLPDPSHLPILPPVPKTTKLNIYGQQGSVSGESNGHCAVSDYTPVSDYTHLSPKARYAHSSNSSSFDGQHSRKTAPDRMMTTEGANGTSSALDEIVADIKALEMESSKAVHRKSEPFSMPRRRPRSNVDADRPNVGQLLVSAVRAGDHKLITQLLDRGASPDTGSEVHALNEAILRHDAESVRLLLLYGADPNIIDKDGVGPLVTAIEKSYLDGAIALLKYGANPNMSAGSETDCPVSIAAVANNIKFTRLLLMYGGNANQFTADGNTLLIGAISKKTPKHLIDMLLNYGAGPNEKNREGKTALFEAISSARVDIVSSLIEHGANPNLPGPKHMLWPSVHHPPCLQVLLVHGADHKKCPGILELAASINNVESMRILLNAGVDPNSKKDGVYTPLCTAIRDNRKDIFDLLLRNGADPNVPASEYPCFKCVTHHREQFLPALVAAGGNLDSPKGILETAVTSKNGPALKWLLDQGVDPNEKTAKGYTALTSAIRDNNIGFVDTLLSRGANPNIRGQDWPVCMAVHSPEILARILAVLPEPRAFKGVMEMAVVANQLESVKLLLAAGVSVEDKNGGVFSPLTSALREYRRDIVVFLINEGQADVNAPGEHLPIVKALRRCATEHTDMIDMLLDKGADPNKIYRGWNGIMQAIENGDIEMLKKLAQKSGVDLDVRDELGRTVTEIAMSRRWEEAVDVLRANAR